MVEHFIASSVVVGSMLIAGAASRGVLGLVLHVMAVAAQSPGASTERDGSRASLRGGGR